MKDCHEIFESENLPYFIHAGTLLGAVRNKGIIPWDDDIDLGIDKKDEKRFIELIPVFEKYGYRITYEYAGFKIHDSSPHAIDVMVFDMVNNEYRWDPARNPVWFYSLHFFEAEDVYPLKDYLFGEFYVKGPQKPLRYLNRTYPNWGKIGFVQNHQIGFEPFEITENIDGPALPLGPLKENITKNNSNQ